MPITFPLLHEYERLSSTFQGIDMATDREGKPMIEGRSDDRDHDEDPDDDDLWYGSCR